MIDLMVYNWSALQERFNEQTESEKEEYIEHFNSAIDGLGDTLFGDVANIIDFKQFVNSLDDEE